MELDGTMEKMEVDGTMEKILGNEQSEGKHKKRKTQNLAKTEKEKVKKITEEEGKKKKITEEEGEVKKSTHGEGQPETMKVDETLEKNPANDRSKSNKMNGVNTDKEGQMKKNRQEEFPTEKEQKTEVIETLVNSLTKDELKEVLKSFAQNEPGSVPDFLNRVDRVASRDELKRTLYVTNLNQETSSEMLRKAFLQYGNIEKAKVIVDKESGKSIGFGFVQFCTKSSALSALSDPQKEINGRQTHCSLQKDQRKSSSTQNRPERIRSIESCMEVHGPGQTINPVIHGPGGFVNPTTLGRGEYANPFGPRVNPTFPCNLNSQAVLGDFQFPHQWGHSNLQYEYSGSPYGQIEHEKGCGCCSIYCKEGEVKKTTHGQGQMETMTVDGRVEKNPENDQSKSNKMNGMNIEKEGQMKKNRQEELLMGKEQKPEDIETFVNSLTKDELEEVLKSSAQNVPDLLNHIDHVASRDESKRTLYVNKLNQETSSEMLRQAFLQYGKIEKAKVIVDKESGKSTGFGFVQFCTKSSALSALRDPKMEINGRQAYCSLQKDQCQSSSTRNKPQHISTIESYMEVHGSGESVNPVIHGPGGFVNPTTLGQGEYANPSVFGSRVNPTFPCHLISQAVLDDFQFPNQWGHSNLQYGYSGSQYSQIAHEKECGCCSIYCKEGEIRKTTHGEGQVESLKVDGTGEKNPENDRSKSNKMNGANIKKEWQMKKNRKEEILIEKEQNIEVIETLVNHFTKDELKEVLKLSAQNVLGLVPDLLNRIEHVASRDESKRTLYVNNLNQETSSEMLKEAFLQYGKIEKAEVIVDKESGKCVGFGFVQFHTKSNALSALRDPKKEINGRQIHCSLQKDQWKSSSTQNKSQHMSSIGSYMEVDGPGESVNPSIHGPGGFVNTTTLGRGGYAYPTVFGPRVNPTSPCHLNPQAVLGDFQFPNQRGDSNLQYEYSNSQYNKIERVGQCGCGSIYCDL